MAHTEHRSDDKTVATNRKARHDYTIVEILECGIQLTGTEVKSLRLGQASLVDCFARLRGGELWLEGMHIPPYEQGDKRTHEPTRPRKLLVHRRQLGQLQRSTVEKGLSMVPLQRVLHPRRRQGRDRAWRRANGSTRSGSRSRRRDAMREAERELGRRR